MLALVKKGLKTIQNDGLHVFGIRIWNFSMVKLKRIIQKKDKVNYERWQALKNKYKDERLFIVGNGPSLNKTPLYLLQNEYTMCFNRINLLYERINWKPELYVVVDDLVIKDNYQEINTEVIPTVKNAFFPDIHPSNLNVKKYINQQENVYWFISDKPEFRSDLPNCGHNKTVVNAGLQIAAYLGFKEIYMIGVDMDFGDQKVKKITARDWEATEDDPNHFDPRYFQKGRKYHNPTVHEMLEQFQKAKTFFDRLGVKIFNAGIGGKLEIFPRVNFNSLFNYNDDEIATLLINTSFLKQKKISLNQLQNSIEISDISHKPLPAIFKTSTEYGANILSKLIYEYMPVGPFNEHYFFIKR
jgi:hypothetical protein